MTWTKLGEEFGDECWTLSDKAFRLHVEGLLWSNRKATDGQLAKDDVRRWGRHPEMAAELVDRGWWKDRGGHYEIIHHIGYQRTAEQIVNQSIANKENAKRRWSRGKPNQAASVSDSECDSHNDSECNKNRTDQNRAFKREGPKKEPDGTPVGDDSRREGCLCVGHPEPCHYCRMAASGQGAYR